jgi:hypothetical protein
VAAHDGNDAFAFQVGNQCATYRVIMFGTPEGLRLGTCNTESIEHASPVQRGVEGRPIRQRIVRAE